MGMRDMITSISNDGMLKKPGDSLSAEITKSGRQVIKIDTDVIKHTATRYPSTGTVVETIVRKKK